jgi:hypothetical protein
MRYASSDIFRRMCLGLLGAALGLSVAACGNAGVSQGAATINNSNGGEGVTSGNGTATLTWTAVTQNTDGTLLTDLAGYKVFYGVSASAMNTVALLSDPTLTTYVVRNLPSGTWYFAVAAYTSSGTEGAMSNIGTKTIS